MYCKTKRKIADCVKSLICQKGIQKITIQDIMNETHMSRQSFYYHFKDIYDVLEWIGIHDFAERIKYKENEALEAWLLRFIDLICAERIFCERLVQEIHWPKLLAYIRQPIETEMMQRYGRINRRCHIYHSQEPQYGWDGFISCFCYYLMDYVYHKRDITNEEILQELRFAVSMLEGPQAVRQESPAQRAWAAG